MYTTLKTINCSTPTALGGLQNGSDMAWVEDWAQLHVARPRDIELLTGLSFYHDRLSVEETLQLKTSMYTV